MHEDAQFSLSSLWHHCSLGRGKGMVGSPTFLSVDTWVLICKTMELGWIQLKSSMKHTALGPRWVEMMHTAAEKLRYIAVPVIDNQSSVRAPGVRSHPFWEQRSEKATWKK